MTFLTIENNSPDIHSDPSIKSDTGQHSQFLRCLKWKMSLTRDVLSKSSALTHQKFFPNLFIRKTRNYTFYIAFIHTDISFIFTQKKKLSSVSSILQLAQCQRYTLFMFRLFTLVRLLTFHISLLFEEPRRDFVGKWQNLGGNIGWWLSH